VENAKSELMAALRKEAEAARRRSQRLVEIGKRMPNPHEQNELISMALAEGRAAEAFDRAVEFLQEQAKA
jgi:hypothetical protein